MLEITKEQLNSYISDEDVSIFDLHLEEGEVSFRIPNIDIPKLKNSQLIEKKFFGKTVTYLSINNWGMSGFIVMTIRFK